MSPRTSWQCSCSHDSTMATLCHQSAVLDHHTAAAYQHCCAADVRPLTCRDHVTDASMELCWLPVCMQIQYRLCPVVHWVLNVQSLNYTPSCCTEFPRCTQVCGQPIQPDGMNNNEFWHAGIHCCCCFSVKQPSYGHPNNHWHPNFKKTFLFRKCYNLWTLTFVFLLMYIMRQKKGTIFLLCASL